MNAKILIRSVLVSMTFLCISTMANKLFAQQSHARYAAGFIAVPVDKDSLTIVEKYSFGRNKKETIRIYPNPSSSGNIHVSAVGDQELQFYVFELDGTMVSNIRLSGKEKKTIKNLRKGTYTYDVFLNDEGVESGTIVVK
jgi:hypothetical protein